MNKFLLKKTIQAAFIGIIAAILVSLFLLRSTQSLQFTSSPSNTPSGQEEVQVIIPGTADKGIIFTARTSGLYSLTMVDGAFSTYSGTHWISVIRIYKNKPLQWGILPGDHNTEPVGFDYSIGFGEPKATEKEASALVTNFSISIDLQSGDRLLFIPNDIKGHYGDNRGQLVLQIGLSA